MSFKEKHEEYQKEHQEYMKKVNLWFILHECDITCPLYKYHSIDKTSLNSAACEYLAMHHIDEVADVIEEWYDTYKKSHSPIAKFYEMLGINAGDDKPWENFDKGCTSICNVLTPCINCSWWKEGAVD